MRGKLSLAALSRFVAATITICASAATVPAQASLPIDSDRPSHKLELMQERIDKLESEVAELKVVVKQLQSASSAVSFARATSSSSLANAVDVSSMISSHAADAPSEPPIAGTLTAPTEIVSVPGSLSMPSPTTAPQNSLGAQDRQTLDFLRDTTINFGIDGYYGYNFNNPIGGVNLLRAYDVRSNQFSLNQANLVADHPPDPASGRRWGGRLDLQYGLATATLQGNPSNEPRPDIYRNIFQVYGTYVVPVGKGITVDFGKWSSSLGIEGNYTKDQINYSRSFWFNFLPFYHMGLRASIPLSDRFSINYWVVNGINQVEATNGFKDELFGFTAEPVKTLTWTVNYYLGQEHPDRVNVPPSDCPVPVQAGLCFQSISPAPNGLTNIFDSYATWHATPKLTFALEGDYYTERLWEHAAPGEPTSPAHVDGGAAYVQYQFSPKFALATRAEYMSDRQGVFSGMVQALKENTVTFDYNVAPGFLMRYEWRRDYSNQRTFYTDVQGVFAKQQDTATVGIIWWWGRKEGAW
jgi:hypothetical protein